MKLVSVTFDDGWKSSVTRAFPLLQKYQVPATFYIISQRVDDIKYPAYMNKEDLRILADAGHEIGSHTKSHLHLPELSDEQAWEEIEQGVEELRRLGFASSTFAYPFGEWNSSVVMSVRKAGLLCARSVEKGANDPHTDPYLLRGNSLRMEHSVEDVMQWIDEAPEGSWVIILTHQIEPYDVLREGGMKYGTTPEVLEGFLSSLQNRDVHLVTVKDGLSRMVR